MSLSLTRKIVTKAVTVDDDDGSNDERTRTGRKRAVNAVVTCACPSHAELSIRGHWNPLDGAVPCSLEKTFDLLDRTFPTLLSSSLYLYAIFLFLEPRS